MRRRVLSWGAALVAVIAVGGYWLLFPPLPRLPEIARDLPSNFAEADEEFGSRVKAAFPLPLAVDDLAARLSEQGFSVNTENSLAVFETRGFPCALIWRIHWETEDESVSALSSIYGGVCL
jgi:hypothetical protein